MLTGYKDQVTARHSSLLIILIPHSTDTWVSVYVGNWEYHSISHTYLYYRDLHTRQQPWTHNTVLSNSPEVVSLRLRSCLIPSHAPWGKYLTNDNTKGPILSDILNHSQRRTCTMYYTDIVSPSHLRYLRPHVLECRLHKLADTVTFSCRDDQILGFLSLQH